jgi:hypothetical protein
MVDDVMEEKDVERHLTSGVCASMTVKPIRQGFPFNPS